MLNLRLTLTGLCALVTDNELGNSSQKFTKTTTDAWALLVGPRPGAGHDAHGDHGDHGDHHGDHGGHANHPLHEAGIVVEYDALVPGSTSNPDRLFDDPFGRHYAIWNLAESTLEIPGNGGGPVELATGLRDANERCGPSEFGWRDISSLGEIRRGYQDVVFADDCLSAQPPVTRPVFARVHATGGRFESIPPAPGTWPRKYRWAYGTGYERAVAERLEYTNSFPDDLELTLTIRPYDPQRAPRQITVRARQGQFFVTLAISNLAPELRGVPIETHLELYHGLFDAATKNVPTRVDCEGGPPPTSWPDSCPMVWLPKNPSPVDPVDSVDPVQ
jgi:hypothetical protein